MGGGFLINPSLYHRIQKKKNYINTKTNSCRKKNHTTLSNSNPSQSRSFYLSLYKMKFSISSLLVLGLTLSSCVFSSPLAARNAESPLLSNTHQLVERSVKYPVKPNDALVTKIMASVKTDLYAKVFGSITGDVSILCHVNLTYFYANTVFVISSVNELVPLFQSRPSCLVVCSRSEMLILRPFNHLLLET